MRCATLILLGCVLANRAAGCDTALLLAVDVSGSISNAEYSLQMQGLADALEDPRVIAALVGGQDRVALVHWSGRGKQRLSLDWQAMTDTHAVAALADTIRALRRPQDHTDTAIGEALFFALAQFPRAAACHRHVIDLSGDGAENAGTSLPQARARVAASGVTLNAIAIEKEYAPGDLTRYFHDQVITRDGFVITARGLRDYPRAIRAKLLRELLMAAS